MSLLNLELPKENIHNQFIAKSQFYEHGQFNSSEKEIFVNCIERITLYSQLTRENTNIAEYKDENRTYEEVSVFLIELRKKENIDKIAKLIMNSIPYPMILIQKYENEYIFYGAHHRDNKIDSNKTILEKAYNTGFINKALGFVEKISYKNLSKINFHSFYDDYIQELISFNLEKRNIGEVEDKEKFLEQIENLEEEIALLENRKRKEKQFNKKMDLNIEMKKLEKELKLMEG